MCLICKKIFFNKAKKPSRLIKHLKKTHYDKTNKKFVQSIHNKFQKWLSLLSNFCNASQPNTDGWCALYISHLTVKSGKLIQLESSIQQLVRFWVLFCHEDDSSHQQLCAKIEMKWLRMWKIRCASYKNNVICITAR